MPDAQQSKKVVITARVTRATGAVEERVVAVHHPDKKLHDRFQKLLERGADFTEEHVLHDNPPPLPRKKRSSPRVEKGA